MKRLILILISIFSIQLLNSQNQYDAIEDYDIIKDGWAKVRLGNKFGFIDKKGKEIVPTIYDKIESFDSFIDGWALVVLKGKLGFINKRVMKL